MNGMLQVWLGPSSWLWWSDFHTPSGSMKSAWLASYPVSHNSTWEIHMRRHPGGDVRACDLLSFGRCTIGKTMWSDGGENEERSNSRKGSWENWLKGIRLDMGLNSRICLWWRRSWGLLMSQNATQLHCSAEPLLLVAKQQTVKSGILTWASNPSHPIH